MSPALPYPPRKMFMTATQVAPPLRFRARASRGRVNRIDLTKLLPAETPELARHRPRKRRVDSRKSSRTYASVHTDFRLSKTIVPERRILASMLPTLSYFETSSRTQHPRVRLVDDAPVNRELDEARFAQVVVGQPQVALGLGTVYPLDSVSKVVDHVQLRHRLHERWVAVPHRNVAGDGVVVGLAFGEGAGVRELDPVGSLDSSPSSMAMKSMLPEPCAQPSFRTSMPLCFEYALIASCDLSSMPFPMAVCLPRAGARPPGAPCGADGACGQAAVQGAKRNADASEFSEGRLAPVGKVFAPLALERPWASLRSQS